MAEIPTIIKSNQAEFVEQEEERRNQALDVGKKEPRLPSIDLPPPPSPPRDTRNPIARDSTEVDHFESAWNFRAGFQSPLPTTGDLRVNQKHLKRLSQASRRHQRKTVGPMPTFKLFAPSAVEPHRVPSLQLLQKRKNSDRDAGIPSIDGLSAFSISASKHPRLGKLKEKSDNEESVRISPTFAVAFSFVADYQFPPSSAGCPKCLVMALSSLLSSLEITEGHQFVLMRSSCWRRISVC